MKLKHTSGFLFAVVCVVSGFFLASCNQSETPEPLTHLSGAGSTFSATIYRQWFTDYHNNHPDVQVDYDAIGSGTGTTEFINGTVDFGASDSAMTDAEISQVSDRVVLIPMTAGAVVLAYNLPGVNNLRLSRVAYSRIFLGKITKWNDAAIASANPGIKLPDTDIVAVHRSDSSGTTFVFTKNLSAVNVDWKQGPGSGKTVVWPAGLNASQNEGVAEMVKQTPGAIGYVEYGYAGFTGLSMAALENKSGNFIEPSAKSAAAALANVPMPPDLRGWAPDPDGADSYPIVSYTWLLCHSKNADPAKGTALRNVITYGLTKGQSVSEKLGYIPLRASVIEKAQAAANTIK